MDKSPFPVSAPELVRGFELRDRYDLPKPTGNVAIYVDSVSMHHFSYEVSTIVWKDAAGHWHRSEAVEIGPGLLSIPRKLESNETRDLTTAEAAMIERLIKDPKVYNGKVKWTGEVGVGAPFHVMAVISPYGRTTVRWHGRLVGKNGAIADLVLGHD